MPASAPWSNPVRTPAPAVCTKRGAKPIPPGSTSRLRPFSPSRSSPRRMSGILPAIWRSAAFWAFWRATATVCERFSGGCLAARRHPAKCPSSRTRRARAARTPFFWARSTKQTANLIPRRTAPERVQSAASRRIPGPTSRLLPRPTGRLVGRPTPRAPQRPERDRATTPRISSPHSASFEAPMPRIFPN